MTDMQMEQLTKLGVLVVDDNPVALNMTTMVLG